MLALAPEDIHPLKEGVEGVPEGRRALSWIWKVVGITEDANDERVQSARRSMNACECLWSSLTLSFQLFVLNGAGPVREQCDGQKKYYYCERR